MTTNDDGMPLVEIPSGIPRTEKTGRTGLLPDGRVQITVPCPQAGCPSFLVGVGDVPRYSDTIVAFAKCPLCGKWHTLKYTIGRLDIQIEWS